MAKVFFDFEDAPFPSRTEAEFDRSQLRLGALVHVEGREIQPKFFSKPTASSHAYAVSWIAPSEWYVRLTREYQLRDADFQMLVSAVGNYATADEVRAACDRSVREMPIEKLYLTRTKEQSSLGQFMTVAERIDLVSRLSSAECSSQLSDHYEPMVVYLMLTCFDVLGQPADWRDFRNWLDGKEATNVVVTGRSVIEQSKQLYEAWSKQYGVRNSFYRFMDEVLPADTLRRLLASIEYLILSNPPAITKVNGDDDKKKRWLFDVRNRFTHRAQVNKGFHPERFARTPLARETKQYRFGSRSWEVILVGDWPMRIIETVRCGLAAKIRQYSTEGL